MIPDGDGAAVFTVEYHSRRDSARFVEYTPIPSTDSSSLSEAYIFSSESLSTSQNERIISPNAANYDIYLEPRKVAETASATTLSVDENPNEQSPLSSYSDAGRVLYDIPDDTLYSGLFIIERVSSATGVPDQAARGVPATSPVSQAEIYATSKKKYKPVALKTRPLQADLPEKFRIRRRIIGDPLAGMPTLDPNPPPFTPGVRYTEERRAKMREQHSPFLN